MSSELLAITKRYNLSVDAAGNVECPCGRSKGKLMGELCHKEIYWFAHCVTKMSQTTEFRLAVKAARIIRAARKAATAARQTAIAKATNQEHDDAKHVKATCRDCGHVVHVPRHIFDRRGTRCLECGGKLDATTGPVGVYVTLREATEIFGCTKDVLNKGIRTGELPAVKTRGRWRIGLAACERYLRSQSEMKWFRERNIEVSRGSICPRCKKVFRNWAAMKLHIRDNHEDF